MTDKMDHPGRTRPRDMIKLRPMIKMPKTVITVTVEYTVVQLDNGDIIVITDNRKVSGK